MALRRGLIAAMRSRCAVITSLAERSFARIRRAISTAVSVQMSCVATINGKAAKPAQLRLLVCLARLAFHTFAREVLERDGDTAAREGHARRGEPHLDAAQRAG